MGVQVGFNMPMGAFIVFWFFANFVWIAICTVLGFYLGSFAVVVWFAPLLGLALYGEYYGNDNIPYHRFE